MQKIVADPKYRNGVMSAWTEESLSDAKIACLIDYMKSLADK